MGGEFTGKEDDGEHHGAVAKRHQERSRINHGRLPDVGTQGPDHLPAAAEILPNHDLFLSIRQRRPTGNPRGRIPEPARKKPYLA